MELFLAQFVERLFGLLPIFVASSLSVELIVAWLRSLRSRIKDETVKKITDVVIVILSVTVIFGVLAFLIGVSATFVYGAMAPEQRPSFNQVVLAFIVLFSSSFAFVHIFGYCFAGLLHWFWGKLWPKGIDYVYYFFGTAVLLLILAKIYGEQGLLDEATRAQVVAGVYLFSLKLFKTSYELFPDKFKWTEGWIRDPFFGRVI